jgi:hypothetical protein
MTATARRRPHGRHRPQQIDGVADEVVLPRRPQELRQVERHHLVTDELVDDRGSRQDPRSDGVEPVEQLRDVAGRHLLRERREAADIGEQDADFHLHPTDRRLLEACVAEVRVLARRAEPEASHDLPANSAVRGVTETTAWLGRQPAHHPDEGARQVPIDQLVEERDISRIAGHAARRPVHHSCSLPPPTVPG